MCSETAHSADSFPGQIKTVKMLFVSVPTVDAVAETDTIQFDVSIVFWLYWIAERDGRQAPHLTLFKDIFTHSLKSENLQLRLR